MERKSMLAVKIRFPGLLVLGSALLILSGGSRARCERLPLPAPLQAQVNHAIDCGVVYLFKTQPPWGTWTVDPRGHPVGYAALPGLTLLECGEPEDHPAIRRAASFVRQSCAKLDATYDLSLAILFLDRLGDSADEKLIKTLALRLIAGQSFTGGWSYRCPVLSAKQSEQLLAALHPKSKTVSSLPASLQKLPVLHPRSRLLLGDPPDRSHDVGGTTDNSNSQFAALALWVAQRHAVPMERTLALIKQRFTTSQNPDGSWGYHYYYGGGDPERPAMTCVGLLGLAIGHGLAADQEARENPALALERAQAAAVVGFHPPLSFFLLALERAEKKLARERAKRRGRDVQVLNGFVALNKHLGEPLGRTEDIPQNDLYFLWSVERVAVLYDLPTIGHKDWYRWGAEMLVANQKAAGNWENGGYPGANPVIDTCLALLFLKRTNLVADLTTRLPFDSNALNSSINQQVTLTTLDRPFSPVDPEKSNTPKTAEAAPTKTPEPETNLAAKAPSKPAVAALPLTESPPLSEDTQERGSRGWLWFLVVLAFLLFIACGILLTSYSLALDKEERPRRVRPAKGRPGASHRFAKHWKR